MAIETIKKEIADQKELRARFKKSGKEKYVKKIDAKIKGLEEKLKGATAKEGKPAKKTTKKPAKSKISGMSREKCIEELDKLKKRFLKAESTKKKNIKDGKAYSDGSLKPGASLDNEADTIEGKAGAGHSIDKKQQKAIPVDIAKITQNVVKMIKTQKDSLNLLRDLIRRLQGIEDDVKRGKLYYEG